MPMPFKISFVAFVVAHLLRDLLLELEFSAVVTQPISNVNLRRAAEKIL